MKAIIRDKSALNWSNLTRQYTFDVVTDEGQTILTSQVIEARPAEVVGTLQAKVAEYQAVYEEANDVEVGEGV